VEALQALGTVVWLSGDLPTLCERALRSGDRPMLQGKTREEIETLYKSRQPFYAKADLSVDTTRLNPDQVAAEVLRALRVRARPPHPALSPKGGEGSISE
jgi:shikimate kinase